MLKQFMKIHLWLRERLTSLSYWVERKIYEGTEWEVLEGEWKGRKGRFQYLCLYNRPYIALEIERLDSKGYLDFYARQGKFQLPLDNVRRVK